MGRPSKSVKKFTQKHLKTVIDKRRKLKPMKNALRHKEAAMVVKRRKAAAAADNATDSGSGKKKLENMNVDELMDGDFLDGDAGLDDDGLENGSEDDSDLDHELPEVEGEDDFVDITPQDQDDEDSDDDDEDLSELRNENKKFKSEIEQHKSQLEKLKEKDPEFYEYLKEHDEELLGFEDDEVEDEDVEAKEPSEQEKTETVPDQKGLLTAAMVDKWCAALQEKESYFALRKLLSAFRSACHYGEGDDESLSESFVISNSQVFNKVMIFVLSNMDGIFRKMLHVSGDKNLSVQDLRNIGRWKKLFPFVRSYLASALHVLSQMTDNRMISFTLRRLRPSIVFLGEFPALARKYLKAILHFWSTGEQSLSFIAFTLIRDMPLQLGTEYLDFCSKSVYKHFVSNTKFINASSLPHTQFLANCVVELYGIDMAVSYQNAFSFIRQMAIILRNALTVKSKDAYKKVYCWQYVASLELWVKVVSAYPGQENLQPLAYPLAQIIGGVARLVPTARYFPLRMQCAVMLNKLASATNTFVPVASVLLDMLEFKEMRKPPTGGAGSGLDFQVTLKVPKPTMKTRSFQEECVLTVLEQLAEHLTQWCCSVAFPELVLLPLVQIRRFVKETNVDRFRRQAKQLVDQIERNIEFVTRKRDGVPFSPKDTDAVASFLKEEKEAGTNTIAQYCNVLRQRAKERKEALTKSSVELKERPSKPEEDEDGGPADELFNKKWHAQKKKAGSVLQAKKKEEEEKADANPDANPDEDVVEDLLLSSDDEEEQADEEDDLETKSSSRKKKKLQTKRTAESSDDEEEQQTTINKKTSQKIGAKTTTINKKTSQKKGKETAKVQVKPRKGRNGGDKKKPLKKKARIVQ